MGVLLMVMRARRSRDHAALVGAAWLLLAQTAACVAQSRPAPVASGAEVSSRPAVEGAPITAREQELWERVVELGRPQHMTQPASAWFESARRRREGLLEHARLYGTLYPGGAHRDEAIRIELTALFELSMLQGGDMGRLRARAGDLLKTPPSVAAAGEAAYWMILGRRAGAAERGTSGIEPDEELPGAYWQYVQDYPTSRHVPRLASLCFDAADRRGDSDMMRAAVEHLREHFPGHVATEAVRARWHRRQMVGELLELTGVDIAGQPVRLEAYRGQRVLVVVWEARSEASCRCVAEVERFRAENDDVRVVGVCLEGDAERTRAAACELNVDWPQVNDGLGWGGGFVRQWGLVQAPAVFVVDRSGRLVVVAGGDDWRGRAEGLD